MHRRRQIMNSSLKVLITVIFFAIAAVGQQPVINKVEPPSWWLASALKPVRILITGKNLQGGRVETAGAGFSSTNFKSSPNGHYLFADISIAETVAPGNYEFTLVTASGRSPFHFEIFQPLPQIGNFQGFSQDDFVYFIFLDRFADGDRKNNDPEKSRGLYDRSKPRRYHGGDLQGAIEKLGYVKSLGATAIWTTPIYDNNDQLDQLEVYDGEPTTGYHGYGPIDFYAVDEHFGTLEKLREFVSRAHQAGFVVIQDQIANHTGPYHPWVDDPPTPTWFNGTRRDHIANNWQKWTTMNPRASYQTQRSNLEGWFIDILPDLNQNDPEVEKYLIQNSLWWIARTGFDAIRMDTLPHVPRKFWANWSAAIHREFPRINILGELFDTDPALIGYFQRGRRGHDGIDTGIDTLFDFSLFSTIRSAFIGGQPIRLVSQTFAHDWLYPRPEVLVTFLGNHDVPRFMSEKGATISGMKLALTCIMTSRGTPILYYGDEIAMDGGGDPDNRRDFPGGFAGDSRNAFTAAGRNATENEIWNFTARLGALRRELEPLRRGRTLDLFDGEQQMAFARFTDDNAVIVVINNAKTSEEISFDVSMLKPLVAAESLTDRLGNVEDVTLVSGKFTARIPARTAAIFTKSNRPPASSVTEVRRSLKD